MYIHLLSGKGFACRAQVIAPRECCALSSARAGVILQCTQCWQPGRDVSNGHSSLQSLSSQFRIIEGGSSKKFGDGDCQTQLQSDLVLACFLQDAQVTWPWCYKGCNELFWCYSHQEGGWVTALLCQVLYTQGSDSALPQGNSLKKIELTDRCLSLSGQDGWQGQSWVKHQDAGWDQHHSGMEAEGFQ